MTNTSRCARSLAFNSTLFLTALGVAAVACVDAESPAPIPGADAEAEAETTEVDAGVVDSTTIDASIEPPCDLDKPFAPPVQVTELNTSGATSFARLTADMKTVYFHVGKDASTRLYQATRSDVTEPFGAVTLVEGLATVAEEGKITEHATTPTLSPDGLTIFFQSLRSDVATEASVNIWFATRAKLGDPFGTPSLLSGVNGTENTGQPFVTSAGTTLYYSPRRGGANHAAVKIYRVPLTPPTTVGTPVALSELDSDEREEAPVLSADERTIYFARQYSIWSATRADAQDAFSNIEAVPNLSEPTAQDFPTWISPDSCVLYLTSSRSGENKIYTATRPK